MRALTVVVVENGSMSPFLFVSIRVRVDGGTLGDYVRSVNNGKDNL